jgi:uncharacterized protein (DUF4213/DUF364 family)
VPSEWEVRLVDENLRSVMEADVEWSDAVFVSGMHVQRGEIERLVAVAHRHGKVAVVGGPSASGCPEYYPDADVIHVGEIGDATDELVRLLDETVAGRGPGSASRPSSVRRSTRSPPPPTG